MAKPTDYPDWATATNYSIGPKTGQATKVQPTSQDTQEGNIPGPGYPPEAQKFNWWMDLVAQWIRYLEDTPVELVGQPTDSTSFASPGTNHAIYWNGSKFVVGKLPLGGLADGSSKGDALGWDGTAWVSTKTFDQTGLDQTQSPGARFRNTTPGQSGAPQYSPFVGLGGHGYDGADYEAETAWQLQPDGSADAIVMALLARKDGGSWGEMLRVFSPAAGPNGIGTTQDAGLLVRNTADPGDGNVEHSPLVGASGGYFPSGDQHYVLDFAWGVRPQLSPIVVAEYALWARSTGGGGWATNWGLGEDTAEGYFLRLKSAKIYERSGGFIAVNEHGSVVALSPTEGTTVTGHDQRQDHQTGTVTSTSTQVVGSVTPADDTISTVVASVRMVQTDNPGNGFLRATLVATVYKNGGAVTVVASEIGGVGDTGSDPPTSARFGAQIAANGGDVELQIGDSDGSQYHHSSWLTIDEDDQAVTFS